MELSPRYNPSQVEDKWYQRWKEWGYFRPSLDRTQPAFSIAMPPPNVTGVLHLGHALNTTWQDILIRYHRMRGDNTLWVPGTDHAGISTQAKVDELLRERGQSRHDLGRDAFLQEVWRWREEYGGAILDQIAKLGASVDWDRLRFTLDEGLSQAVTEVFVRLYEEGLLYRGNYITNWCVSCRTALSDIEVEHHEESGKLTAIAYSVVGQEAEIIVATTRPETMLGDTAVAVHPDDPRYQDLIGQWVELPLVGRRIPIIADAFVDQTFGTGAVKVTPAHDPNDFDMGKRHQLEEIKVIDEDGRMTNLASGYQGLSREEARRRVLLDLSCQGALRGEEVITHAVGHCERCDSVIEPLLSLQWFVRVAPLAAPAIEAVKTGDIQIVPERFVKIYMNWMENVRDWCISRQLWWGHRIPAYYCRDCGHTVVSSAMPNACPLCQGELDQDPDVLDTWFSSALWPFSTLGWPESTEDLALFYPTSVLSTGYDIIFFWVARMIMQGIHFTGEKPFSTVLLHGLVRDSEGHKMSKSRGNGVDPLEVVTKHGADGLRIALVLGSAPGNDYRWSWERFEAGSHFANKVYNAVRFVLMNRPEGFEPEDSRVSQHPVDQWIWGRLNDTVTTMTEALEQFEFGQAARAIYDFWWDDYCDWYIEMAKVRLKGDPHAGVSQTRTHQDEKVFFTGDETAGALTTLIQVARRALALLHPFMPFVTEELFWALNNGTASVMVSVWPLPEQKRANPSAARVVGLVQQLIRTGRNLRHEVRLNPSDLAQFVAVADDVSVRQSFLALKSEAALLLRAKTLDVVLKDQAETVSRAIAGVTTGGSVFLRLDGLIDLDRERERLSLAIGEATQEKDRIQAQLDNPQFVSRAPADVVKKARESLNECQARLQRLKEREAALA